MFGSVTEILPPGTKLNQGQYTIIDVLGQGGFGITYQAHDTVLDHLVAIKEYFPQGQVVRVQDSGRVQPTGNRSQELFEYGLDRYIEEARALARFHQHAGVVSVLYFFKENGTAYMVMEYLQGETVKSWLKGRGDRVHWNEALLILTPVMKTLADLHMTGLIHRDISPDNIYLCSNGAVKLIDFGAARQALGEQNKTLSVILKQGYAPFEQYTSKGRQGPWTDVYALGATLYRMVSGKRLPEATDRMFDDEVPALVRASSAISQVNAAALIKALSVYFSDRYQDIASFQADLQYENDDKSGVVPVQADNAPEAEKMEQTAHLPGTATRTAQPSGDQGFWPADQPRTVKPLPEAGVGDIVYFGNYPQESKNPKRKQAVAWRVLDAQNGRLLLIAEQCLDCKRYHDIFQDISWESSTIRHWLKNEFINEAFTPDEKARILLLTLPNPGNARFGTPGGQPTQDRVFLLSLDEVHKYMPNCPARQARATGFVQARGAWVSEEGASWWWLRSPGSNPDYAAGVHADGDISDGGSNVNHDYRAVRPALWLKKPDL